MVGHLKAKEINLSQNNMELAKWRDGETFCIKAKTMDAAIKVCETSYLETCIEEGPQRNLKYRETILS